MEIKQNNDAHQYIVAKYLNLIRSEKINYLYTNGYLTTHQMRWFIIGDSSSQSGFLV